MQLAGWPTNSKSELMLRMANIQVKWVHVKWTLAEPQKQWNGIAVPPAKWVNYVASVLLLLLLQERAQVGDRLPTLWQLSFGPLARWPVGLAFCSQLESEGGFGHYLVRLRFVFPGQWVNYCFMICFGAASAAANILCVMCLLPAYKHYCSYAPRPVAYASCCAKR